MVSPSTTTHRALFPRAPVLDWSSFKNFTPLHSTCIDDARSKVFTTSGRAALYQALLQLRLPPGSPILVPTYHCPTMVAPIVRAGLTPVFFGIRADGLPDLEAVAPQIAREARGIIVAHYFGLGRSLADVRQWCDRHGVALIEDCAHCFFGEAGERPVGHWGDFATASLSKFFPVPEAGVLASSSRSIAPLDLRAPSLKAQVKGWADVLEVSVEHNRLGGIKHVLGPLFGLKKRRAAAAAGSPSAPNVVNAEEAMMASCDMGRVADAPLAVSLLLNRVLPRGHIAARRRENFARYARHFANVAGARPVFAAATSAAAPYVFPLWVDDAERVYAMARAQRLPIFRWDRIWPGTPVLAHDHGPLWSHHVLQLLCHQDLSAVDVDCTATALLDALRIQENHE